jgi:hypothetical protein
MRARREVTISVICALLVACSAAASAPNESHDPTIEGVGILPGSDGEVLSTDDDSDGSVWATVSARHCCHSWP